MKAIDMHFQDFVEVYNETNQYMVNDFRISSGRTPTTYLYKDAFQ